MYRDITISAAADSPTVFVTNFADLVIENNDVRPCTACVWCVVCVVCVWCVCACDCVWNKEKCDDGSPWPLPVMYTRVFAFAGLPARQS